MSKRKTRAIETMKRKRRRVIPRDPVSRNQGNTSAGRTRAKKLAGIARARAAAPQVAAT